MRLMLRSAWLLAICFLVTTRTARAQNADLSGEWQVTITQYGQDDYARLTLKASDGHWIGKRHGETVIVSLNGSALELHCHQKDENGEDCGTLTGQLVDGVMSASGKIFGEETTLTGRRTPAREHSSTRHEFVPKAFYNYFSSQIEPSLKIKPGETVHTTTVDAGGVDASGAHRAAGGNPLTGPFYVEGAWPGDTLVVKFNRLRLNRDSAGTYSNSVVLSALDPYYVRDQKRVEDFDATWKLDRAKGVATLTKPTERLKNFEVPLAPMLGCVGVAPYGKAALQAGHLGNFGGNMDYNQIREGATLYFPVYHPGALLFVGDGHAAEGDGELTGNALETSMDVEFTVDLIEGSGLDQPRAENDQYMMVSGIGNSLEDALQSATTGISSWLASEYKLNQAEIAMVLGSSMRYDIAEVVDPSVHVVAKLPKSVLRQLAAAK